MAMGLSRLSRRSLLRLVGGLAVAPALPLLAPISATAQSRRSAYAVDLGLLWETTGLRVTGILEETIDRAAGRYEILARGAGSRIVSHVESRAALRDGRWVPEHTVGRFEVLGRPAHSDVRYDYARGLVEYRSRGETFFLRRPWVAEDVVPLPAGERVDDVFSAALNYADGRWPAARDGQFRTSVVRRQRPEQEGVDDVRPVYRAEVVPLAFSVTPDRVTGRPTATIDLTRFSPWARDGKPARIVFGPDRRLESITAALILGTTLTIRLSGSGPAPAT